MEHRFIEAVLVPPCARRPALTSVSMAGWDNNGKPGNQVATKSLPSHEIFGRNPAIITIYVKFIY